MELLILSYIDPGSGLLIWQLVLSAFAGFAFSLKKVRAFLGGQIRKVLGRSPASLPSKATIAAEKQEIEKR